MHSDDFRVDDVDPRRRIPFRFPFMFRPHPLLSPYVRCYWLVVVPESAEPGIVREPKEILLIPDGGTGLLFSLNLRSREYGSVLLGVRDVPEIVYDQRTTGEGAYRAFGIDFAPGGLYRFFNDSMKRYLNRSPSLGEISPAVFGDLSRAVPEACSAGELIGIVEAFLFRRLEISKPGHPAVDAALDLIAGSAGTVTVENLSYECASSRRNLNRQFSDRIGLPVKTFARIVRLRKAIEICRTREDRNFLLAACETGYFDQSHFIRDFREFTGRTPGSFFSDR